MSKKRLKRITFDNVHSIGITLFFINSYVISTRLINYFIFNSNIELEVSESSKSDWKELKRSKLVLVFRDVLFFIISHIIPTSLIDYIMLTSKI